MYLATVFFTFAMAVPFSVMFEIPFMHIEKFILFPPRKPRAKKVDSEFAKPVAQETSPDYYDKNFKRDIRINNSTNIDSSVDQSTLLNTGDNLQLSGDMTKQHLGKEFDNK